MKASSFALALSFAMALVATAQAQEVIPPSQQTASQPPAEVTGNAALRDYNANINPNVNVPTTGIYDESDRYSGPDGRPLPGWGSVKGEGAGDNGG